MTPHIIVILNLFNNSKALPTHPHVVGVLEIFREIKPEVLGHYRGLRLTVGTISAAQQVKFRKSHNPDTFHRLV